ncbi:hypothetical protein LABALGNA3A7_05120 [Dellaglioa algida]|nr:hypothetical protein LABALGNA3A7_05120 [Dellaglioa algida]
MKIVLNDKQEIISYVIFGDIENSIEYDYVIPDGFEAQFKPSFFMVENGAIRLNPNYEAPITDNPETVPTQTDKTIAQLMLQQAQQKMRQDKFNAQLLLEVAQLKENK